MVGNKMSIFYKYKEEAFQHGTWSFVNGEESMILKEYIIKELSFCMPFEPRQRISEDDEAVF